MPFQLAIPLWDTALEIVRAADHPVGQKTAVAAASNSHALRVHGRISFQTGIAERQQICLFIEAITSYDVGETIVSAVTAVRIAVNDKRIPGWPKPASRERKQGRTRTYGRHGYTE